MRNALANEFHALQRGMDRMFDDMLARFSADTPSVERRWRFQPACDVDDAESHYVVSFDIPGVPKEKIKIEILNDQLVVSGERKAETVEKSTRWLTERAYGAFQRSFAIPSGVEAEKVEASYQDGVLRIAIPKSEAAKPRQIKIADGKSGFFTRLLGKDNSTVQTTATKVA